MEGTELSRKVGGFEGLGGCLGVLVSLVIFARYVERIIQP